MDQIEKFIRELNKKWADKIRKAFSDIVLLNLSPYDIEKMKSYKNLYRLRLGKIRIVFRKEGKLGNPIYIEYRGEAYKKF